MKHDNHSHDNVLIPEVGLRVKALESLLAEKKAIDPAALASIDGRAVEIK